MTLQTTPDTNAFQRTFRFNDEDLAANREGRLSDAQRAAIRMQRRVPVLLFLSLIGLIILLLNVLIADGDVIPPVIVLPVVLVSSIVAEMLAWQRFSQRYVETPVYSYTGMPTVVETTSNETLVLMDHVMIDLSNLIFSSTPKADMLQAMQTPVTIYYLPLLERILSIEDAAVEDAVATDSPHHPADPTRRLRELMVTTDEDLQAAMGDGERPLNLLYESRQSTLRIRIIQVVIVLSLALLPALLTMVVVYVLIGRLDPLAVLIIGVMGGIASLLVLLGTTGKENWLRSRLQVVQVDATTSPSIANIVFQDSDGNRFKRIRTYKQSAFLPGYRYNLYVVQDIVVGAEVVAESPLLTADT